MIADLIVFNPTKVHDRASYPDPFHLAEGFDVVVVNGKIARENGRLDAAMHGRVLQPE
jgi:N-acyl-D-amino-acid deacylase